MQRFLSLGKDEKEALIKWQELNAKLQSNKRTLKETGTLPIIDDSNIEEGTLKHITALYFQDRRFLRLAKITQTGYIQIHNRLINTILFSKQKQNFANLGICTINREFCKNFYENLLALGNIRSATHYINALSNLIKVAIDYGYFKGENPCSKMLLEKNAPRDQTWTVAEFKSFCDVAKNKGYTGLYIAVNLAYYTAQRLTDVLNLKWSQIDADFRYITIKQSKTATKVEIPLFKMNILSNILLQHKKHSEHIVLDQADLKPYHDRIRLFSDRFDAVRKESNTRTELLFRDLRRTAILALDEAGCTPAEIASISGHSRSSIIDMLDTYAPKTKNKAESALDKLNARQKT